MTITEKNNEEPEIVVNAEHDAMMVTAVGVEEMKTPAGGSSAGGGGSNEPPIPVGHSRYYCSKCHAVS